MNTPKHMNADDRSSSYPTVAYAWYAAALLTLAATLSFIDRQILAVVIEPVKESLQITDAQIGLLLGLAFVSFYSVLSIPAGWLADNASRRLVMGSGIFLWSLMTVFSGSADSYSHLFLARMGVGIGEAMLVPAAYSMLTDLFSREKLPAPISLYSAAPFIGIGLAFMLGGSLNDYLQSVPPIDLLVVGRVLPWQLTFWVVGIPGIVLSIFVLLLKEPQRRGVLTADRTGSTGKLPKGEIFRFISHRRKYLTLHFIAFVCLSTQGYALFSWVVSFFVRSHHFSRGDIGVIVGAITMIFGLAGSISGGFFAGRMTRNGKPDATLRLVIWSAALITPIAVTMGLINSATAAIVLLVPIMLLIGAVTGLGNTSLQIIAPNQLRGQLMAMYLVTVNFIAYLIAPLSVALLTENVFQSDDSIGRSLSAMAAFTYPVAAIALAFGLKHYRLALQQADQWEPSRAR